MSGVEEGGGEPSSGIPPTKKAPPASHRSGPSWPFPAVISIDAGRFLTNCSYSNRHTGKSKSYGENFRAVMPVAKGRGVLLTSINHWKVKGQQQQRQPHRDHRPNVHNATV